jgi:hypothetical protein
VRVQLQPDLVQVAGDQVGVGRDAGIVDQQVDVPGLRGRGGHRSRIGDVQGQHLDAGDVDELGITRGGINLGGAPGEQLEDELTADTAVGAGDQRDRTRNLHTGYAKT